MIEKSKALELKQESLDDPLTVDCRITLWSYYKERYVSLRIFFFLDILDLWTLGWKTH